MEDEVEGISVVLAVPRAPDPRRPLGLWMTHLGGSAAKELATMQWLVDAGWCAVSFDPSGHGRRATTEDPRAFAEHVLGSFRQRMWPILGQATLEAMRVIDWALARTGGGTTNRRVVAGGVSMGGDIAIALAGIDSRVHRVGVVGATPDWHRPGMRSPVDASQEIDQGPADAYAAWYADQLDPSRHLDRYLREVPIVFHLGGDDVHIPAAHATAFRDALQLLDSAAAARVTVQEHPGLDHFGVTTDEAVLRGAVNAMTRG